MSLVLVLAMVFSFASTAFAAGTEYADDDQIQNGTAVAVMSGIGIINGKENNMFDPSAKFLRSEAAKIMTYMILGPDIAQDLTATDDPFPDVPADHWAAPYVAYVSEEGLVGGWGGNYHPDEDLGREEWLKMLLGVIGYDTSDLVGTNWSVKTVALARQAGLVTSAELKLDFNRDTAVLYAWNAMNTEYVVVDDKGVVTEQKETYGKEFFGLNKTNVTADDFQRPIVQWTWTDAEKPVTVTDTAVLTIENEAVTLKDIQDKLGDKEAKVYHRIDGATTSTELTSSASAIGGRGSVIELYIPDAARPYNYRAVVINTYAAKLTAGNITKATETDKAKITIDSMDYETDEFVENDVVLYTKAGSKIQSAEKAEVKEGTVTALSSDSETEKYVRIDGEITYKAENTVNTGSAWSLPTTLSPTPVNFWYDTYGNLVFSDNIQAPQLTPETQFYVIAVEAKGPTTGSTSLFGQTVGAAPAAKAQVIDLATGEVKVVDRAIVQDETDKKWYYETKNGEKFGETAITADAALSYKGWVRDAYLMEDGSYSFVNDTSNYQAQISLEKGKNTTGIEGVYATSSTKLTVISAKKGTGDSANVFTEVTGVETYVGYANFPAVTSAPGVVTKSADGKVATDIVVIVDETTPTAPPAVYAVYAGKGETDANGTQHFFYVKGERKTVYDKASSWNHSGSMVVDLKLNADGTLDTSTAAVSSPVTGAISLVDTESKYVVVSGTTYYLAADCEIFDNTKDSSGLKVDNQVILVKKGGDGEDTDQIVFVCINDPTPPAA